MSLTREQIGTLELTDDTRAALLRDCDEREREQNELARLRADKREDNVKTYLAQLSEAGLKDAPGDNLR